MAEQDHDGDVDVDDGDVDLAPPHESLHQKTLVSRPTLRSCVMRSEGPLSHQPDGPIQTFSGDCFRLSVRFCRQKSILYKNRTHVMVISVSYINFSYFVSYQL